MEEEGSVFEYSCHSDSYVSGMQMGVGFTFGLRKEDPFPGPGSLCGCPMGYLLLAISLEGEGAYFLVHVVTAF